MSILNKRNAVFGWAVWQTGKKAMKMKAKRAVPSKGGGRGRVKALVAGVATAVGAAYVARRLAGGGSSGGE